MAKGIVAMASKSPLPQTLPRIRRNAMTDPRMMSIPAAKRQYKRVFFTKCVVLKKIST